MEVMIGATILLIFMTGSYKVVTQMMWVNQTARDHFVAANLAFNRLERIRNATAVDAGLMAEYQVVMTANGVPFSSGNFRRNTTVNVLGTNLTEVICRVDIFNRKSNQFDGKNETMQTVMNR